MKSNYKKIGQFIRQVDVRNKDLKVNNLLGVSVQKKFIPSIANTIGTDFTKYKVVKKGQFTYIPDTSRRGDKIGIALLEDYDVGIVSNIYTVFEVTDIEKLLPEYLMLWFMRPEFDRYARFKSHGSVREIFDWEQLCNVELPVPTIERQEEIVKSYRTITDRIALKQRINDNLEATAQAIFEEMFSEYYRETPLPMGWQMTSLDELCTVKGGKRLPPDNELINTPTKHPYIRVRDIGLGKYVCLTNQFQYIDEETHSAISRYIVNTDDVIISIVGTIGLIGKIHSSLNGANLTENCVKLSNIHTVSSDYLYHTIVYKKRIKEIELLTVGAVQAKLPMYNIQAIPVLIPSKFLLSSFQDKVDVINKQLVLNMVEMQNLSKMCEILLSNLSERRN